ncbi:hypothetical protein [Streptomyces sp. NPDC055134]
MRLIVSITTSQLFGYGIGLESHQQNISLVLDRQPDASTRLRLLLKDNDAPRINLSRLRARLGDACLTLLFDWQATLLSNALRTGTVGAELTGTQETARSDDDVPRG